MKTHNEIKDKIGNIETALKAAPELAVLGKPQIKILEWVLEDSKILPDAKLILLIEDYEKRKKTAMIELKKGGNYMKIKRLEMEAGCYGAIISELREIL